ncbi:Zn-ribbon domain-containing OB-fold protein [Sphingobium sp. EM0848]|uniref:Zn-ribbon domain-containing OB-fold protein n=1 Tax=Sphingobium sp. EM0848 TaxID=2743473 RepID=UPI00159C3687|nr:zinc ribbon domain-containing protein [Sphingobium sp. EM0848]
MIGHTGLETPYWSSLAEGKLSLPRCSGCGQWQWPVAARCGECGHWGSEWQDVPLSGHIFSWTRTWHRFGGTEALPLPYVSLLAEIDGTDGKRLMGLLEGVGEEDRVRIGAPITGRIGSTRFGEEDVPVIIWRLRDGGEA